MPSSETREFLSLLKKSQLLNEQQMALAVSLARGGKQAANNGGANNGGAAALDPQQLSNELVRQGLLTAWQQDQLLRGQTGFVLQKYRLLKPVGKGGMGHVFQAVDDRSQAIVAIKVMARKLTGNQTLVNRFRREIKASSQLNNPHIVRTLDAGRVGNVDFMVMEFVNGDQLDRVTRRIPMLPVGLACEIIRQAATGLQHAHEMKMVHRDIKPANLIIDWAEDGAGTIKLMDMGLVRLSSESDQEKTVTRAGQVMGTPDYMSPEQAWDTTKADIRSDIYSLGCTIFRMLTGRVPFPGENPLQVLMARCSRDAPNPASLRPDLPEPVDQLVSRMMLRDPEARFQTPAEVAAAIAPYCEPLTISSLKAAAQAADADEADLIELQAADQTGAAYQQDDGYQQFLREMGSGAAVDLMNSSSPTPSGGSNINLASAATIPILDHGPATSAARLIDQRTRKQSGHMIAYSLGGAAMLAMLAIVWWMFAPPATTNSSRSDNTGRQVTTDGQGSKGSSADVPVAELAKAEPINISAGQHVSFSPQLTIIKPAGTGSFRFRLGPGAPAAATIDSETGQVAWQTTEHQTAAEYKLPIELTYSTTTSPAAGKAGSADLASVPPSNTDPVTIAQTWLIVNVSASMPKISLPLLPPLRFVAGATAQVSFQSEYELPLDAQPRYSISAGQLAGMQMDAETGQLSWIPAENQVGRHQLTVKLQNLADAQVLATADYEIRVAPAVFSVNLPDFPQQTAIAGQPFQMTLISRPGSGISRLRGIRIRVADQGPAGVSIDLNAGTLKWDVPKDASGVVRIPLVAEPAMAGVEFTPDSKTSTIIMINVQPAGPNSGAPSLPAEADLAAADEELRELYKRELAAARTPAARTDLSRQIYFRCLGQPGGATDYAMLLIAEQQADRARAVDVLLDLRMLKKQRYGVSELDNLDEALKSFSRSALSQLQQDIVVEHVLRLGLLAAQQRDWSSAALLLNTAQVLLKNGSGVLRQFYEDVEAAQSVVEQLQQTDDIKDQPSETNALRIDQVVQLLKKWQFQPLFDDLNQLSFLQSSNNANPLPDNGRPLWKLADGQLTFEATAQAGVAGFVDARQERQRYVVRFEILDDTNALQFVFGAGREQDLSAFLLTLDNSAFGQIQRVAGGNLIAPPATNLPTGGLPLKRAEIMVDGTAVAAGIDGVAVTSTQIADLQPGRIGLIVPLQRSGAGPKLHIRNPRILQLPDAK